MFFFVNAINHPPSHHHFYGSIDLKKWCLVGGLEHLLFSIIYGMSSFPLTFILFQMVETTNQVWLIIVFTRNWRQMDPRPTLIPFHHRHRPCRRCRPCHHLRRHAPRREKKAALRCWKLNPMENSPWMAKNLTM